MNIKFDKRNLVESLLVPASKLSDNICLSIEQTLAKTLVTSSDNSIILIASVPCEAKEDFKCIIPDTKTFLRLFAGIDSNNLNLSVESNVIKYSDSSMSFKYHLLDDSYYSSKKSLSEEKLNQVTYDTTFNLPKAKLSDILKFNSIIPDAEKLYVSTNNGKVFAKIGDEQKSNTNEITTEVSDSYEGALIEDGIPINVQNILLLSFNSENITVGINHQLKIFKFETPYTKYIISGLVK
jgi:hypothetical protein